MPPRFRLRFDGAPASRAIRDAAAHGLYLAAEHVLTESTAVVPLDEGPLQNSGTASVDEPSLTAAIAYDTPYSVRQHEELDYRHAPGRQAKYLEGPLNAAVGEVAAIIAAQLRRAMR